MTAHLNIQHDYITLRAKFPGKRTFNLTKSWGGCKVSGTEATREALMFFDRWMKTRNGTTPGQYMKQLADIASTATNMQDFIQRVPE